MRKLDNKSCEGLRLQVKRDSQEKLEKPIGTTPDFSQLFMKLREAKSMKFCTQVPRTCLHKRLVFDFHNSVHKFKPINIRYLLNLHFLKKMAHIKHAEAYKKHK